jgi:hypothetical protein
MARLDTHIKDSETKKFLLRAQKKQFQQELIELFFLEIETLRAKKYTDSEKALVKQFLSLPKNFDEVLFYAKKCKEAEEDKDNDYTFIIRSRKCLLAKAAEIYLLEKDPNYQVIGDKNEGSVERKTQKATEYFARLFSQELQADKATDSANRPSSPGKR